MAGYRVTWETTGATEYDGEVHVEEFERVTEAMQFAILTSTQPTTKDGWVEVSSDTGETVEVIDGDIQEFDEDAT